MTPNPKIYRLFAVFSWCGVALSGFLLGYMLHMIRKFPEIESFNNDVRLIGGLLALWLLAAAWFTVRAVRERKRKNK